MKIQITGVLALALAVGGCATLGGPSAVPITGLVYSVDEPSVEDIAARVRAERADVVLISATHDGAWFTELATQTGLKLSGPGDIGTHRLAFLTRAEALGDTTITLAVPGGGRLFMHDALYRLSGGRTLDLMYVRMEPNVPTQDAARTLLQYIASDVGATAAVMLAVEAATPGEADALAQRMRAYFPTARECADNGAGYPGSAVRVLYGPAVRMGCASAALPEAAAEPTIMRLRVGG
jgi:hypothetical protein